MLKSTHKPTASAQPLADGWTEHTAPTGHSYYYNVATKESTYTRPTRPLRPPEQTPFGSQTTGAWNGAPYADIGTNHGNRNDRGYRRFGAAGNPPFEAEQHYRGGGHARGVHGRQRPHEPRDRPKTKQAIPGCEPWLLVTTKLGRRFVHNPGQNESFWKFPPDVMKGVVEFDRLQREKRDRHATESEDVAAAEAEFVEAENLRPAGPRPPPAEESRNIDSDGESYEEVEVTDDDDEENTSKRQKTEDGDTENPVEFDEDDIAYQLQAMGQDYGLDPGEYGDGEREDLEEGAEGLPLTEADSKALFNDMLDDYRISPYTPWEKLIEAGEIVEDDRYTVLSNMRSRKDAWDEWSRNMIQRLKEQREKEEKKDARIPYFAFLQSRATPKLYWPEFRRKYQKEPEMRNTKLSDKDREKWYREYINRLKFPEPTQKSDLIALLKSLSLHSLNRSSSIDALPSTLLTDMRYVSLRHSIRDPLIEAHISTLAPPPTDLEISPVEEEALAKEREERERRERALAERQRRVEEEKRRQGVALRVSRGALREGVEEVERVMRVGRGGLLGHMDEEGDGEVRGEGGTK